MNKEVNFELAKLLKEKGFDDPTSKYFRYDGKECENKPLNWNEDVGFFSRPSIAEVVMWLYEKYHIWIYVKPGVRQKTWDYIVQKEDCDFAIPFFEIKQHKPFFNFPTEAYEAAILYTLNNLI